MVLAARSRPWAANPGTIPPLPTGDCTQACALQPMDVIKTRLQLDTAGKYRGILHAGRTIAAEEGTLALWKGLTPFATHLTLKYALRMGSNSVYQNLLRDKVRAPLPLAPPGDVCSVLCLLLPARRLLASGALGRKARRGRVVAGAAATFAARSACTRVQEGKLTDGRRMAAGFMAGITEALVIVTPFEARARVLTAAHPHPHQPALAFPGPVHRTAGVPGALTSCCTRRWSRSGCSSRKAWPSTSSSTRGPSTARSPRCARTASAACGPAPRPPCCATAPTRCGARGHRLARGARRGAARSASATMAAVSLALGASPHLARGRDLRPATSPACVRR